MNSDAEDELFDDDESEVLLEPHPSPEINDFDDWLNFIYRSASIRPSVPSPEEFAAMSKRQQKSSCNLRFKHIARFEPIATTSRNEIIDKLLQRLQINRIGGRGARGGAVLTGYPYIGKTTLAIDIGKRYDLDMRKLHKNRSGDELFIPETNARFIPVIYVCLSSEDVSNMKALYATFARFLGVPKYETKTTKQLEDAIVKWTKLCQTSFIIIDEIHYIDIRSRGVVKTNNAIKTLMNRIPATFLFAGIDCENTGIFFDHNKDQKQQANPKLSQLNHRCLKLELRPFQRIYGNYEEGLQLINTIDNEIVLVNHQKGDLEKLAPYILARTNGHIGSIRDLILLGCHTALKNKSERLIQALLDKIQLDNAAQIAYQKALEEKPLDSQE